MVRCPEIVKNIIFHDAPIVHLADAVKNCLEVGGRKFYSTPPNSPDLSPQFSDLILRLHGKQL